MNQQYPSILLEKAVGEFSKLPGIGRKTAMRLVLHLLRQDTATVEAFGNSIITLKREVKYCKVCHNISDTETCQICANPQRDASTVCVVENIRDVMAVEATQQYRGLYHVLGGVISPMDGVGPSDLQIESLVQRVAEGGIKEVILALSTTMEGDTTNFYIYRKLDKLGVKLSVIARGISIGDELEYLFGTDGGDLLVPLLDRAGYVVVEAFLFMSDELLDRRAAFLRPFFIEPTAEGYDLAIDQQDGRYLVREFRDDVSGLVVGLDAELFSVLAVLAEQEPCEPVEDRSFADAVAPVNLRERGVELDRQITQSLEIEEPDFFNDYRFHLR